MEKIGWHTEPHDGNKDERKEARKVSPNETI